MNGSGKFPNDFTVRSVRCRPMGVKVAVVGGGSTYTPELVEGFVTRGDRLPVDELVLLDIDPERLEIVGGLAERQLRRVGLGRDARPDGRPTRGTRGRRFRDRPAAGRRESRRPLQGRDDPARVRLHRAGDDRRRGVRQSAAHGAGGARARRAHRRDRRARARGSSTSRTRPGSSTQALLDQGHRALGLCNVAIGFQREFAAHFGVEPERVQLEHVGLNHLTWERKVLVDGVDRLPRAARQIRRASR